MVPAADEKNPVASNPATGHGSSTLTRSTGAYSVRPPQRSLLRTAAGRKRPCCSRIQSGFDRCCGRGRLRSRGSRCGSGSLGRRLLRGLLGCCLLRRRLLRGSLLRRRGLLRSSLLRRRGLLRSSLLRRCGLLRCSLLRRCGLLRCNLLHRDLLRCNLLRCGLLRRCSLLRCNLLHGDFLGGNLLRCNLLCRDLLHSDLLRSSLLGRRSLLRCNLLHSDLFRSRFFLGSSHFFLLQVQMRDQFKLHPSSKPASRGRFSRRALRSGLFIGVR